MATKVMRLRHLPGKYAECHECGSTVQVEKPIELELPYCSTCNHGVEDAGQCYCGWCGEKFEEGDASV